MTPNALVRLVTCPCRKQGGGGTKKNDQFFPGALPLLDVTHRNIDPNCQRPLPCGSETFSRSKANSVENSTRTTWLEAGSRLVRASLLLVLAIATMSVAHAGPLATFLSPAQGLYANDGTFVATLRLTGSANPRTLKVTSGNVDVTNLFSPGNCRQTPCTVSATLMPGAGVLPGHNYLTARVRGANGSVDIARQRFSYTAGLGDPTTGTTPGHLVAIRQVGSTVTVMTPTPVTLTPCSGAQIQVADFDRMTLALKATSCYQDTVVDPVLSLLDQRDLIIVAAPGGTGVADFTRMGGTGDKTNKAGYYAVGYGAAAKGVAFEAWQESDDAARQMPYKTIQGTLVNFGCTDSIPACAGTPNAAFYGFQPTNAMGFVIVPGAAGTPGNPGLPTIYVGNPSTIAHDTAPPSQARPQNSLTNQQLLSYQRYSPQWTGGNAAGGMYLVTLNRSDLTLNSQTLFVTNCGCTDHTNDNTQINALATALSDTNPNRLFLLTTVGIPFNKDSANAPIVSMMGQLAVSPSALQGIIPDSFGNTPKPGFSMVAYRPFTVVGMNKLYSTAANTQQRETGALKGTFAKNHTAYYEAQGVAPFFDSVLPTYPSGDDYLADALSSAIGSSEPVAWPQMDSDAKRNAYIYLSSKLIQANLAAGKVCGSNCFDVRYYYTGTDAPTIYRVMQPKDVPYPGDAEAVNNRFTASAFSAVQQQLQLESVYLGNVVAYESYNKQLTTNDSLNVASALRTTGVTITNELQNLLGEPAPATMASPIDIGMDFLDTAGAIVAIGGRFESLAPPAALFSGLFTAVAGGFDIYKDFQKTKPEPDPYVKQLQQLTQEDTEAAESAATKFSNDLATMNGIFYNGIYSDWFRLQAVALLSQDQSYGGWYVADEDKPHETYLHTLQANARTKLWQQLFPKYFTKVAYRGVATGVHMATEASDTNRTFINFLSRYGGATYGDITFNNLHAYSWDNRNTPGSSVCEDYTIIFKKDTWNTTWSDAFGTRLFGSGDNSDGLSGPLNLDRNFVYDFMQIPWWTLGYNNGQGVAYPVDVTSQTRGNNNVSWRCGDYPPGTGGPTTTFSELTPSQTIQQGKLSVILGGKVSSTHGIPPGSVNITIADNTVSAPITRPTGAFSVGFDTSQLPSSSTPYTITYSYAGQPAVDDRPAYSSASDVSTALTVNSSNTETVLSGLYGNAITYPQEASLKVVVRSPAGTPTGQVTFFDNGVSIGTANLSSGQATFTASGFSGGNHLLSAQYNGDGNFQPSYSNLLDFTVNRNSTDLPTLNLSSPSPIPYGTPALGISGLIISGDGKPLPDNEPVTVTIGTAIQVTQISGGKGNFSVTLATASLAPGRYPVQVDYPGNVNLLPLSDNRTQVEVVKAMASFNNLSPSTSIPWGTKSVQLGGVVVGVATSVPTGSVVVTINRVSTPAVLSNGIFSVPFDTGSLPASKTPYVITYEYSGDANYRSGSVNDTTLTVQPAPTTTTLISSAPTAEFGATVTLTASIVSPGGVPNGSMWFYDGDTPMGNAPLAAGTAVFTTNSLTIGTHTLTANYAYENTGYTPQPSAPITQVVTPAKAMVTVSSSAPSVGFGTKVTFTASISSVAGPPDGSIWFYDNDKPFGNAPISGSTAVFTIDTLAIGVHNITAKYAYENTSYTPVASAPITQVVTPLQSSFSGLTPAPSVTYGTANVSLSGFISAASGPTANVAVTTQQSNDPTQGMRFGYDSTGVTTDSATFSVWMKTALKNARQMLWQETNADPYVYLQGDQIGVFWDGSGSATGWLSQDATPVTDGQWHHIAVTFNKGSITIYKDGKPTKDAFAVTTMSTSRNLINFGGGYWSNIPSFAGAMWNAKVWASPLSQSDLQADMYQTYDNGYPAALRLISYFDPGTGKASNLVPGPGWDARVVGVTMSTDRIPFLGQYPAPNEQVTVTINNVAQPPVSVGTYGSFSGTIPTASLPPGNYPIKYSYKGNGILNAAPDDSSTALTVKKLTLSFSNLTQQPTVQAGKGPLLLSGTLQANGINPKKGEKVSIVSLPNYAYTTAFFIDDNGKFEGSLDTSKLTAGSYSLLYEYDETANFNQATDQTTTLTVTPGSASTTTMVSSSAPSADYGTQVTFTAVVTASSGTPTGQVVFYDGAVAMGAPVTLVGGKASFPIRTLAVGSHAITATYTSDVQTYVGSTSTPPITQAINKPTPSFSGVTASQTVGYYTASVTLSGSLSAGSTYPAAGEQVSIALVGAATSKTALATIGANGSFSVSVPIRTLSAGSYPITYSYAGSTSLAPATDNTTTLTIGKITPVFENLTPSQTITVGSPSINLAGKISQSGAIPTGLVLVTIGDFKQNAPIQSDGSFSLTFNTAKIPAAVDGYRITYSYAGDANFNAAADSTTALTVQTAATTTTVASSANPAAYGTPVTFTATVSSSNGAPTGTVTFMDGTTTLGTQPLSAGSATLLKSDLAVGVHSITAVYSGTAGFTASTSAALTQTVNKLTPAFSNLTTSQTIAAGTASITVSGKLAAGAVIPSGSVSVTVNGPGKPAVIGGDGTFSASIDTSALTAGTYTISYAYAASTNFNAAADSSTTLTVQTAATTTTVTSSANPAAYGTPVTFTATVASAKGTPGGSVTFRDGTTVLGNATLGADGTAAYQASALAPGQHNITAAYSGGSGYAASTSSVLTQVVKAGAAFSSLTSPVITFGVKSLAFTGVVAGAGPTYPDGSSAVVVTIAPNQSGQRQGSAKPDPNGNFAVTVDVSSLAAGTYTVRYDYSGDAKLNAASDAGTTLTVRPAGPVQSQVILTASPNPSNEGQTVTFTATVPRIGGILPTGNVTISEPLGPSNVLIYGNADLVNGVATIVVDKTSAQQLSVGRHILFATYGGDGANYAGATSQPYTMVVNGFGVEPQGKAALKVEVASVTKSGDTLTVGLKVTNTGNATASGATLTQVVARTLTGTGAATVRTPLPISLGEIAPSGSVTRSLTLTVPATVQRISLTETGTLRDVSTPSATFTASQMVIIPN